MLQHAEACHDDQKQTAVAGFRGREPASIRISAISACRDSSEVSPEADTMSSDSD